MAERKAVQTLQRLAALAQDDRPPPRSDVIPRAAQGRERLQFLIAAISGNWRLLAGAGEAATTHIEAPCYGFPGGFCVAPHGEEVKGLKLQLQEATIWRASGGDELLAQAMTTVNGNCDRLRDANPASVTEPAVGRGARNRYNHSPHTPLDLSH